MLFCFDFFSSNLLRTLRGNSPHSHYCLIFWFCFTFRAELPPHGMAKYMMTMRHSTAESTASTLEALNGLCTENKLLASTIKLVDEFLSVRTIEATVFHENQYILFHSYEPELIRPASQWILAIVYLLQLSQLRWHTRNWSLPDSLPCLQWLDW